MFCDSVIMRPERQELLPQFRSFRRASQIGGDRSNFDLNLLWENIQASKFKNIEKENMKHRKKWDLGIRQKKKTLNKIIKPLKMSKIDRETQRRDQIENIFFCESSVIV